MTALKESLYYRVAEKIAPGVVDALVANGQKLCQFELSGSVKMTLLGINSQATSWLDLIEFMDLPQFANSKWASTMLRQKNMALRELGNVFLLSNSFADNPLANTGRMRHPVLDLRAISVQTGVDEIGCATDIISRFTPKWTAASVSLDLPDEPGGALKPYFFGAHSSLRVYQESVSSDIYSTCASMVFTFGYTVARGKPVLVMTTTSGEGTDWAGNAIDITALNQLSSGTSGDVAQNDKNLRDSVRVLAGACPPGVKYCFFLFKGTKTKADLFLLPGQTPSINDENWSGSGLVAVPILDDGSPSVTCYASSVDLNSEYFFELPDNRYPNVNNTIQGLTMNQYWMRILYPDGFKDAGGLVKQWSAVPAVGYDKGVGLSSFFLPLLALPLDAQHYVCGKPTITDVEYTLDDGTAISIQNIKLNVSVVATKVTPAWYREYYETGFGLYTPRNSNIQANHLALWDAVDWTSMGVVIDTTSSSISPDIVYSTDLAVEYAEAREKACKPNDWLAQKFVGDITYGELRARIMKKPQRNGFYCVNGMTSDGVYFPEGTEISWRMDGSVPPQYVRKEGDVEEVMPVNGTTSELLLAEFTDSVTVDDAAKAAMVASLSLEEGDLAELDKAMAAASSGYIKERQALRGYVMEHQYFAPVEALSRSGYPTYRYMSSPFAQHMILNCYAQLDKMGDNFVKILRSFTDDVVIQKVLSK